LNYHYYIIYAIVDSSHILLGDRGIEGQVTVSGGPGEDLPFNQPDAIPEDRPEALM